MKQRHIATRAEVITALGVHPTLEAAARVLGYRNGHALRRRMQAERVGVTRHAGVATGLVEVRP